MLTPVVLDQTDVFEVTDLTAITGSITDNVGFTYRLQCREIGMAEWLTMDEGSGISLTGEIGTFDPTILRNGVHEIRVIAEDPAGNTGEAYSCAIVDGGMKLGQLEFSLEDLSSPQLGMPLSLARRYDSRAQGPGDFGPGWNLPSTDTKAQITVPLGKMWSETKGGGFMGIPTYFLMELRQHIVVIRFSDGELLKFKMKVLPDNSLVFPVGKLSLSAGFVPMDTTKGRLEAMDFDSKHLLLLFGQLYEYGSRLYDPKRFKYTNLDGTEYIIHTEKGIESITDVHGHKLTYDEAGITHSSGASIDFTRGAGNRIERVRDHFGNEVTYTYGNDGTLQTAKLQRVDSPFERQLGGYHSIRGFLGKPVVKEIRAPDGTVLGAYEYDKKGRVTAMTDANGERLIYGFDTENHRQTITDRLGNETVYEYDSKGNVTRKTDAMGNETVWTFDGDGNMLTETDALGNTVSNTYDESGNRLGTTDKLGNTTYTAYNEKGYPTTVTDPAGNVIANAYDHAGKLVSMIDTGSGNTIVSTYDANGNQTALTTNGETIDVEYDGQGNRTRFVDPLGNEKTFTYDDLGNQLTATVSRTTPNGPVVATSTREYDDLGRVVRTVDADGNEAFMEYNDLDKVTAVVDARGNRTEHEYDGEGNRTKTIFPDGTSESFAYDAEGNKILHTDRGGNTTTFEYDALKRLVKTTRPDGSFAANEYDALGRNTARIDENGNRTEYEFDAAGRNTKITDASGNVTLMSYDVYDNVISMTDANGNTTMYEYDSAKRKTATRFPDGTSILTEYFGGTGLKSAETDQAGNTTRFEYNAMNRLVAVTDALGGVTSYEYDELGNKILQTDPNGNSKAWEYNNLGKVTRHTTPGGESETMTYDANGNLLTRTDFNGLTVTFEYDAMNRLTRKVFPDGAEIVKTYTATGKIARETDANGVTAYTYDVRDRLVEKTAPKGTVAYTYDAKGNRTSVTTPEGTTYYGYDAMNRLATVTESDLSETRYVYDAVGNRAGVTHSNLTVTEYAYDSLNRLTNVVSRNAAGEIVTSHAYTLGATGMRTRVVENGNRMVDYAYDDLYRLTDENITDPIRGNEHISYVYDAYGNRLMKSDSNGPTLYGYDANDRLTTEAGPDFTTHYEYDANGNTVRKTDGTTGITLAEYIYNYDDKLVGATTVNGDSSYTYDADGIRVSSVTNGITVNYLVDKNRDYAQVLEERNVAGGLIASYVYGDDLLSMTRNGTKSCYHYDGNGNTRALTGTDGSVTDTYIYDAFGIMTDRTGATENNYLYTGEQYDANIGFYYLRARYYNPNIGRFLNVDPYKGNVYDPMSLHRYLYCHDNPVNFVDPSGKLAITINDAMVANATASILISTAITANAILNGTIKSLDQVFIMYFINIIIVSLMIQITVMFAGALAIGGGIAVAAGSTAWLGLMVRYILGSAILGANQYLLLSMTGITRYRFAELIRSVTTMLIIMTFLGPFGLSRIPYTTIQLPLPPARLSLAHISNWLFGEVTEGE